MLIRMYNKEKPPSIAVAGKTRKLSSMLVVGVPASYIWGDAIVQWEYAHVFTHSYTYTHTYAYACVCTIGVLWTPICCRSSEIVARRPPSIHNLLIDSTLTFFRLVFFIVDSESCGLFPFCITRNCQCKLLSLIFLVCFMYWWELEVSK